MFVGKVSLYKGKGESKSIAKLRVSERAARRHMVDAESYCHRLAL